MNKNDWGQEQPHSKIAKDINLKELAFIIKKRLWLVLILTFISTGLGTYYSHSTYSPIYQTSSKIIVEATPEVRNTLQVIMKDSTVLEKVVEELGLSLSPDGLAGQISVASIENTQVVSITVTDSNPERASKIANTSAKVFQKEIPKIMKETNIRPLSEAKINEFPINQTGNRNSIISGVIGLVIGVGLVFLLDSFDDTLKITRDVERLLEVPVLGRVSKIKKRNLKVKKVKQDNLEARGETIGYK
jgi:capsular polysaccharide biosynthesis protein